MQKNSLPQVLNGKEYLGNPNHYYLGDNVAIIGMGNTAISVARAALKKGTHHVTLYAKNKRITASMHELMSAKLEGAEFVFGKEMLTIIDQGPLFKTAIFDDDHKVIGFQMELDQIQADSTVI